MNYLEVSSLVRQEISKYQKERTLFTVPHEGYAVLLEGMIELQKEVFKNREFRSIPRMVTEAKKVAAVAQKFIVSISQD